MIEGVTVRQAGAGDAVRGVLPRWVALPETVEEIAAVLRACAERDLAVVPAGGGTKLHWGPPPERCDVLLDLCCMNEILEHAAGDLVVRAQAGVTMDALAGTLADKGQELALDVPFSEGTTVGGTLATALPGPRSFRYGTARDLLIGITVVLPDGTIARSGGKVVKNVAGYDLGKLFTGSYGTLGVIAEATFRLHPLPADRRWVVAGLDRAEAAPAAAALAASQTEPSAIEVDWPDPAGPLTLAVLVEGTTAEARAAALRELTGGAVTRERPSWWGLIEGDEVLAEARFLPADAGAVLDEVAATGLALRGSLAAGRVLLTPCRDLAEDELAAAVARLRERARVHVLAAPYDGLDRWGQVSGLPLMRRVKERFDPGRRMSPGRFVGGI
ncbi:FAD-binding oxidoreductase [Nonomuraea gerenzanensis]|uniref:Glycolate dehydrogenase, FAD-binding subunit GlcE n=1 Tax=Nonomuraea gerenzanensis TaxID=93944 RepID=A0A1M4E3Q7_9ACTN|nr:FAD-binding oxidoreductase [Nonomuraea gerenzanensis]UBU15689.1 FAD-binding oxidoreductase [Nonomuraea gerenzanensis]SBO93463.1 Glycolate dehydrogenase, FAD-binding subunit GlcE [Nonomuraea gerenzanensis]